MVLFAGIPKEASEGQLPRLEKSKELPSSFKVATTAGWGSAFIAK